MTILKIQKNFRKQIHEALTNSTRMKFTYRIVGANLLINNLDYATVTAILKRLELTFE
jgi:hypothetical protein